MERIKNLKLGRIPLLIAYIVACWVTGAASSMGAHGMHASTLDLTFFMFIWLAFLVALYGRCNDFRASTKKKVCLLVASFIPIVGTIVFIYCLAKSPVRDEAK